MEKATEKFSLFYCKARLVISMRKKFKIFRKLFVLEKWEWNFSKWWKYLKLFLNLVKITLF